MTTHYQVGDLVKVEAINEDDPPEAYEVAVKYEGRVGRVVEIHTGVSPGPASIGESPADPCYIVSFQGFPFQGTRDAFWREELALKRRPRR